MPSRRTPAEALDVALRELGWGDALAIDPQEAVSLFFELAGSAHATSSALDQVLAFSLGLDVPPAAGYVLPPLGHRSPPGVLGDTHLAVRGLGTARLVGLRGRRGGHAGGEHGGRLPRARRPT